MMMMMKGYGNIPTETPQRGVECMCGMKNRDSLAIYCFIVEIIQDRAIFTMERQQELVYDLSNGAVFNLSDLAKVPTTWSVVLLQRGPPQ